MNTKLPTPLAVGITVALVVLMAALFWWRTGTQQAREEPEASGAPQDAIAMDAYERRDREGRSLGEHLPPNRQPGVINHEEK